MGKYPTTFNKLICWPRITPAAKKALLLAGGYFGGDIGGIYVGDININCCIL